ncbi:MAG: methylated-DNA--[protein]-cysteine S-methyltransferase [Ignavibacteria bacterium]|nr:methylated-DNA--[protein]-cysteine S-methyltransferase [Bacteroidota bacterium]MSQ46090.1 methylated-DNA--[protein]-cysteine S-methyltransferase [Ignavibacteria bacterium]
MSNTIYLSNYKSPIGVLKIYSTEKGLCHLALPKTKLVETQKWFNKYYFTNNIKKSNSINKLIHLELKNYFKGKSRKFTNSFDLRGTPFQIKVWKELLKIPFSKVISYKQLANNVKNKNAFRAVGSANGKNPISIIIPCHRVINQNGKLGGYSGGLSIKKYLLELEKNVK